MQGVKYKPLRSIVDLPSDDAFTIVGFNVNGFREVSVAMSSRTPGVVRSVGSSAKNWRTDRQQPTEGYSDERRSNTGQS